MTQSEEFNTNQQEGGVETFHTKAVSDFSAKRLTLALNEIEAVLERHLQQPVQKQADIENMDEAVANIDVLIAQVTDILEQVEDYHADHVNVSQETENN